MGVAAAAMDLSDALGEEDLQTIARVLTEAGELHLALGVKGGRCQPCAESRSVNALTALDKPILRK
jgi:hypothetical protein